MLQLRTDEQWIQHFLADTAVLVGLDALTCSTSGPYCTSPRDADESLRCKFGARISSCWLRRMTPSRRNFAACFLDQAFPIPHLEKSEFDVNVLMHCHLPAYGPQLLTWASILVFAIEVFIPPSVVSRNATLWTCTLIRGTTTSDDENRCTTKRDVSLNTGTHMNSQMQPRS